MKDDLPNVLPNKQDKKKTRNLPDYNHAVSNKCNPNQ